MLCVEALGTPTAHFTSCCGGRGPPETGGGGGGGGVGTPVETETRVECVHHRPSITRLYNPLHTGKNNAGNVLIFFCFICSSNFLTSSTLFSVFWEFFFHFCLLDKHNSVTIYRSSVQSNLSDSYYISVARCGKQFLISRNDSAVRIKIGSGGDLEILFVAFQWP